MQPTEPQPAFVLHARPYRETSLLVDLLTLDGGRLCVLARGVRGPRGQPLRAALQPLQPLAVAWRGRGELPLLASAEVQGRAVALHGDALLAAFYVNELLMRLLPRDDPHRELFWRYAGVLAELEAGGSLAWTLRRFERDLLAALGYGLQLESEADGEAPIDPQAHYRYSSEHGAIRVPTTAGSTSGAALIALAGDTPPPADLMPALRRLLRALLLEQLGGRELRSWGVIAELRDGG